MMRRRSQGWMKVGVVMVKDGEDIIDTVVVLEEAVIMTNQHDHSMVFFFF